MIKYLISILVAALCVVAPSQAQSELPRPETVLEAAWGAAQLLPDEKQERLKPLFVSMAARAGGEQSMRDWAQKLTSPEIVLDARQPDYPDFGWTHASNVIGSYGVDGLIRFAREKREPLHFGRADILLAAGKRLAGSDTEAASRINDALFELMTGASDFEKPELANAAADLAMHRCQLEDFERARIKTSAPNSLRYAFWRARITGYPNDLTAKIVDQADDKDTRHVRQVLDGYRAILELGYCKSP